MDFVQSVLHRFPSSPLLSCSEWLQPMQALMVLAVFLSSLSFLAFLVQLFMLSEGGLFYLTGLCQLCAGEHRLSLRSHAVHFFTVFTHFFCVIDSLVPCDRFVPETILCPCYSFVPCDRFLPLTILLIIILKDILN